MNITLSERTCKQCGVKLTEYEAREKSGLCMDCYNEEHDVNPKKNTIQRVARTKSKQFIALR
ncbi:hypothetical protein [Ammoniphilus sp. CFH 90114]|uniref:hypothetical protein n=1 Tax=Ammoniphilus sp. CFH 90114 TaxID=2493665 RepID=UPI00100FE743|nr:hypothetical protein [Ammoniphilus sp. CFH 90114]RXT15304.1 hypothetical protein EIZ39_03610 [Ammoniphilus sp. CFH 90114]